MNGFIVVIGLDVILALSLPGVTSWVGDNFLNAMTLIIVAVQLSLQWQQKRILDDQEKVRQQRAKLVAFLSTKPTPNDQHEQALRFHIGNQGNRASRGAMVEILLPPGLVYAGAGDVDGWNHEVISVVDIDQYRMSKTLTRTFYAKQGVTNVDDFKVAATGDIKGNLWYRLLYDDGTTPNDGKWARLLVLGVDPMTFLPKVIPLEPPATL